MLTKIVNGQEVECSAEEEAEIRAEWAANAANTTPQIGTPSLEELVAQAVRGNT